MRWRIFQSVAWIPVLLFLSCGREKTGTGTPDSTPPAVITDLAATNPTDSSLTLLWTAPGDDDTIGSAARYDLRHDQLSLTDSSWDLAGRISSDLPPQVAGHPETLVVLGLTPDTGYYFGIKTADSDSNWSGLSNIALGQTQRSVDSIPPAAIVDLRVTDSSLYSLTLTWTAPGDDGDTGAATFYDLRISLEEITEANFQNADTIPDKPAPSLAGDTDSLSIGNLQPGATYYFAIKAADSDSNWSAASNVVYARTISLPDSVPPSPITDLRVTDSSYNSLTLSWTAPGDDGGSGTSAFYDLRVSQNVINETNFMNADAISDLPPPSPVGTKEHFRVGDLDSASTYYFSLKAADSDSNWSDISNIASGVTKQYDDPLPPIAIPDLTVYDAEKSKVVLCFTIPGDSTNPGKFNGYEIRYSKFAIDENNIDLSETTGIRKFYYDPGDWQCITIYKLDSNSVYYFMFLTVDPIFERTGISNLVSAYTRDTIPPATITTLDVKRVRPTEVDLYWINPGDDGWDASRSPNFNRVREYDIRYSRSSDSLLYNFHDLTRAESPPRAGDVNTSTWHTVPGLTPLTSYYFAMKVADEQPNWSGLSNIVHAVTPEGTPPATITDLRATGTTQSTITISWTAPGDDSLTGTASEYFLRYFTEPPSEEYFWKKGWTQELPAPSPPGTTEFYTIDQLDLHIGYYISVRTADETPNWSGISNVVYALTPLETDTIPPSPVSGLQPTLMNSTSIALSWLAPGDDGNIGQADIYDIRYSTTPIVDQNWGLASQVNGEPSPGIPSSTEYMTIGSLPPNTEYFFALKAVDTAKNWSELSNIVRATTSSLPQTWHTHLPPHYGVHDLDLTTQDKIAVTGQHYYDFYVSQLDLSGQFEWTQEIGNSYEYTSMIQISKTANGGCWNLTAGEDHWAMMGSFVIEQRLDMNEFDNAGNHIQPIQHRYGMFGCGATTCAFTSTSEGGFLTAGFEYCEGRMPVHIAKWTSDFSFVQDGLAGEGIIQALVEMDDGNIAYTGKLDLSGWEARPAIVGMMDANLESLWHFDLGEEREGSGAALIETDDGNLLVVGNTNSIGSGDWDIWLIRINKQGIILSEHTIGGAGTEEGRDIIRTADGNYLIVGSTTSFGSGSSDIYLVKVTASADILWEKTLGGPGSDGASTVILAPDGGFIIGGWADRAWGYIVKVNQDGEL